MFCLNAWSAAFFEHLLESQLFPADLTLCASTGWCPLIHSCTSSIHTTAAGLECLPWDKWYPITTHSTTAPFQRLSPVFLLGYFLQRSSLLGHIVVPGCPKLTLWEVSGGGFCLFVCFFILYSSHLQQQRTVCTERSATSLVWSWGIVFERKHVSTLLARRRLFLSIGLNVMYLWQDNEISWWLLLTSEQMHLCTYATHADTNRVRVNITHRIFIVCSLFIAVGSSFTLL